MNTNIITTWYNEAILAPLFLQHYSFADKIIVLLDRDTDDNTVEICRRFDNVEVVPFKFPEGMDDAMKAKNINVMADEIKEGWIFSVDADEFIFPLPLGEDIKAFFDNLDPGCQAVKARIWQVYKHATEGPINYHQPAILQRRHGDPSFEGPFNKMYIKPCIIRAGLKLNWTPGSHFIYQQEQLSFASDPLYGTHWHMADPDLAIQRRVFGRKNRQSPANIAAGFSVHNHAVTAQEILRECKEHEKDEQLF